MQLSHVLLTSGRSIDLTALRLSSTYGEFLEGYPFNRFNEMKIKGLLSSTHRHFPATPVHLVPPLRDYPDEEPGPFGPMELLPPVTCVGNFRSTPLAPEAEPYLYHSNLTVIWFQKTPEVPQGSEAVAGLRGVDWDALARDEEL
ncbi:hypothetical protein ABZ915_10685 [Streptomyces sp. NPDC046915]|uniref:hypothetical protein n=1 Tax=Streptomyces sp. NPDC046915 TaxID=3155257 RepID=UPI00340A8557